MSRGINKVIAIGNLGQDPETRYLPSGAATTSFSIAVSENWTDKQTGEKKERTEWINVETWGKTAEACAEYLRKGAKVFIEGKLQTDSWEDSAGQKKYRTKVRASEVQFLDSRQGNTSGATSSPAPKPQQQQPQEDFDDDIPF
jgi:single-strand DNA-binding protein